MLRNKALAALQRTYDDSYLSCSTAVYYETQGNEDEAVRYWRTALSQIDEHQANKTLSTFVPRSETEKALADSLRELELQCKERIDILEALRISREDDVTPKGSTYGAGKAASSPCPVPSGSGSGSGSGMGMGSSSGSGSGSGHSGWIGDGTIPAVRYPELSRPALPPRPAMQSRTSSELAVVGGSSSSSADNAGCASIEENMGSAQSVRENAGQSPGPEKYVMRHTLRTGKQSDKVSRIRRKLSPKTPDRPGASKAATAAWSALSSRDVSSRRAGLEPVPSPSLPTPPPLPASDQARRPMPSPNIQWDSHSRRLVVPKEGDTISESPTPSSRRSDEYTRPSLLSISAASSALSSITLQDQTTESTGLRPERTPRPKPSTVSASFTRRPRPDASPASGLELDERRKSASESQIRRKPLGGSPASPVAERSEQDKSPRRKRRTQLRSRDTSLSGASDEETGMADRRRRQKEKQKQKEKEKVMNTAQGTSSSQESGGEDSPEVQSSWKKKQKQILGNLPAGVDAAAAKQILNEVVVQGDEVHWNDVAGLEAAKSALRETVVYPFLRPDLFMGLREPARGMLLFGPPGTGKTMLARAVATESRSTFFSISASSLTSKYLGESEKLVRALFALAKVLAPSIIFVDEIDSLLGQRSGSGDHEATRRIKTEFLIQWSDLQRAAAGRETTSRDRERGDANMVLVLAATNLPWAIDEAARRRFVRRQYIPLPEASTRAAHLKTLLGQQNHSLTDADIDRLVVLTEGYSGSDITALAKDAAMGPLRSLGEAVLHMSIDNIRPIELADFEASLTTIRPSVSQEGLKEHEEWARKFGERGG